MNASKPRTAAELAAVYGVSPSRWPEGERTAAAAARISRDDVEARIDALLDLDVPPDVPVGLAERIARIASQPATETPPAKLQPRRSSSPRADRRGGWSRGRRILVGAGVANLFLVSAVAAAWLGGIPSEIRQLFGVEPKVEIVAPRPKAARPTVANTAVLRPQMPLEAAPIPDLSGGREALSGFATSTVDVVGVPQLARPERPAAHALRSLRSTPVARPPELRREAIVDHPSPVNSSIREALREQRARADTPPTIDAIREQIEAARSQPLDSVRAITPVDVADLARVQALRETRGAQPAAPAPSTPPAPTTPPAAEPQPGQAATDTPARPERAERPPRRLRERIQRQRPRS